RTGKEYDEDRNTDVWVIPATGGEPLRISDHPEEDNRPRWSPDGKTIAFVGRVSETNDPKIWLAPSSGGVPSRLAADGLDLIPSQIEWAEGGKAIYFEAGVKGEDHLLRIDLASRQIAQV